MNEPYELSEAFAGLDCKKGQAKAGEREWVRPGMSIRVGHFYTRS